MRFLAFVAPLWSFVKAASEYDFDAFVAKYGKTYSSAEERHMRELVFYNNVKKIDEINSKNLTYKLQVNSFADMPQEEFSSKMLGLMTRSMFEAAPRKNYLGRHVYSGAPLPESIDWTGLGAVTAVKNQGHCGSCYAFSTTGALEGRYEIASGKLVSLSEQQIVDCSEKEGNQGCNGGFMDFGFEYVHEEGICSSDDYAYHGKEESCHEKKCTPLIQPNTVSGFKDVHEKDSQALMEALSEGPVSVAIEADEMSFQFYHSGVLNATCGAKLNHGVLAVGYGKSETGDRFWKVKNSWGPEWGDHGFILLSRDLEGPGECGILLGASFPVFNVTKPLTDGHVYYEKPPCAAGEEAVSLQGFEGYAFCSPRCADGNKCPKSGSAKGQCALQNNGTGEKFCALVCQAGDSCPSGATCVAVQAEVGICMYSTTHHFRSAAIAVVYQGDSRDIIFLAE